MSSSTLSKSSFNNTFYAVVVEHHRSPIVRAKNDINIFFIKLNFYYKIGDKGNNNLDIGDDVLDIDTNHYLSVRGGTKNKGETYARLYSET